MSSTITGVVVGGVVVPSTPLPEGKQVEIHLRPTSQSSSNPSPRMPDLIVSDEISAPIDLPRSSPPTEVKLISRESGTPPNK